MSDLLALIREKEAVVGHFLTQRWQIPYLKIRDPERMKAFSRISARLLELELHASRLPPAVESVVARITPRLARDAAWDVAEQLLRVLLQCWPDERLLGLLEIEVERNKDPKERLPWSRFFPSAELECLIKALSPCAEEPAHPGPSNARELSIERLAALHEERNDKVRHDRAFTALRGSLLMTVAGALGVLTAGLCALIMLDAPWLFVAASAGSIGSMLTGVYRLRDELRGIYQLRNYIPLLVGLPIVGATAAVIVYAAVSAGLVTVGGLEVDRLRWPHYALWGFFAGFSETFFLGIIKRLTLSNGEAPRPEPPRTSKDGSTSEPAPTSAATAASPAAT